MCSGSAARGENSAGLRLIGGGGFLIPSYFTPVFEDECRREKTVKTRRILSPAVL